MPSFRLAWQAQIDVDEIGQYTQFHWGTDQRDEYLTDIDQPFGMLAGNPGIGPVRRDIGRDIRAVCRHYLVFYRVVTGGIEILRVLHVARDVQNLLTDPGR